MMMMMMIFAKPQPTHESNPQPPHAYCNDADLKAGTCSPIQTRRTTATLLTMRNAGKCFIYCDPDLSQAMPHVPGNKCVHIKMTHFCIELTRVI